MIKKIFTLALGDGSIDNKTTLHIGHSVKQEEYLIWKYSYLLEDNIPCSNVRRVVQKGYKSLRFQTKTDNNKWRDQVKEVKDLLYSNNNKKYFSKDVVDLLTLEDLAILYMDDGSLVAKKKKGVIHAYDLTISLYCSKDECERFIEKLKEYDLTFTLKYNKGWYSIRCGTKSAKKFLNLIKPYCPCLTCFKNTKFKEIITGKK